MEVNWGVVATIASPIIALVVGVYLNRVAESRPRLVTYLGHVGDHVIKGDEGERHVYTHSVVVRNAGRRPATNVRVAHSLLPNFNVLPDIEHHVVDLPGGGREVIFPAIVPGEQVTISYLYFPPITWNQINRQIKSDEGLARVLQVLPTQQYPPWFNRLALVLMLSGLISLVYLAASLVRFLIGAGIP